MFVAISLFALVVISRASGNSPEVFGYTLHIVVSPSMEPDINVGDFVVSKKVPINEIEIGDDVIFISTNADSYGAPIIHRVIEITTYLDGSTSLITKGINNEKKDDNPVKEILGKKVWRSAGIGRLSMYVADAQRLLLIIVFIVILILFVKFSVKIYAKYQKNCENLKRKSELIEIVKAEIAEELKRVIANHDNETEVNSITKHDSDKFYNETSGCIEIDSISQDDENKNE